MMSEPNTPRDRRAQQVSLLGLVLQVLLCGGLWVLAVFARSDAIAVLARLMIIGIPIWLVLYLVFKQMRRVAAEALETAELKRAHAAGAGEALFEFDDDALLLEQNRLRWMIKWLLPSVTIVAAIILVGGSFVGWSWSPDTVFEQGGLRHTQNPTMMMWFVVGAGFLSFLYARYSIALAKMAHWRVIRAGATMMAGNAVACLAVAIALMATSTVPWAESLVAYLLRTLLLLIGLEFSLNFVLDLYRPRAPGEIPRPSFDSRLLGLITEPGGIAKSLAEAVNYQFGFEVSKTWFYELLQRWLLPMTVLAATVVLLLTSVVVVDADDEAVIERLGRSVHAEGESLSPGIHLKWPYPIDIVHRAPVLRVGELVIGEASDDEDDLNKPIIWTEHHEFVPELMLLVAAEQEDAANVGLSIGEGEEKESVPVSLLMVSVPVAYRIKNIHDYLYRYTDPEKLLEAVAYQYLSEYAASVDIADLMGPARAAFNVEFRRLIQARIDELGMGIELVFAGVRGAHPPAEDNVAVAFQSVIQAEAQKAADIFKAQGAAARILADVAGTVGRAEQLDEAIARRNALKKDPAVDAAVLAAANHRVDELLLGDPAKGIMPPGGRAAAIIFDARARASHNISEALNKVRAFATDVAAFQAAPELYMQRKQLSIYEDLGYVRRFLIAGDPSNVIVEYTTIKEAALDKILAEDNEK